MSVVGFDFGNSKCVVAIARRGGIDVLQNEVGHRSTPSMVAFHGRQRFIGNEALAQFGSNPANSVNNLKRMIGRRADDKELAVEQRNALYKFATLPNGMLGCEVAYDDKREVFSPEQITGALFQKLKGIAERGLDGQKVADCVIGCPSWWSDQQRRALLDAASIAGLNVLRLMNETTAIALNYGLLRPLPKDKEHKVIFFDLGHSSLNVALVSFVEGKLTVLGTAGDRNLGGRDFDDLLVGHFAEMIKTKYKMDVTTDVKAMIKLKKECERVKLNLSANSKVPFNVEYIMNDRDVTGLIERHEFEALSGQSLLPRLLKPIEELLAKCNVKKEELHAVEVVGGSVRIPVVQKAVLDWFGRDISKTCDGDESVARGCALMCAMISPSFKVREFEVADISAYPIAVHWGQPAQSLDGWQPEDSTDLFTPNNPIPSVKLISFNDRTEPFMLVARYSAPDSLPSTAQPLIGRFLISGMPPKDANKKTPKIKVRVKINQHGVLVVTSAQLIEEIVEEAPAAAAPAAAADAAMTDSQSPPADGQSPTNGEAKMETTADPAAAQPAKTTTKVRREELKVETLYFGGIDQKALQGYFEREASMANQDRVIFETNEARNTLESYVLEMRNSLSDNLAPYVRDEDREKFNQQLEDCEGWLYGDGSEAQKSDYKKKLADLKAVGDPIQNRLQESENRDQYVEALKGAIGHCQMLAQSKDEKHSHIPEDERKKVVDECSKVDQWLVQSLIQLDKQPKFENPAVTVADLKAKKDALEKLTNSTMNKPKPAPAKPAEQPKPAEAQKTEEKKEETAKESKPDEPVEKPMDTTQ